MKWSFYKYQGCGNDFVIIDSRSIDFSLSASQIAHLCHRRFGIGADGLMLLKDSLTCDFSMEYYNNDGHKSSFCGNGGRCIVAFAKFLQIIDANTTFEFEKSIYTATIQKEIVSLQMTQIGMIQPVGHDYTINTGSPHYIRFSENIDSLDVIPLAQKIRYSPQFPEGINVNLVEIMALNDIKVRTYERGVEDETYSCGTGVTAAALIYAHENIHLVSSPININTKGGNLSVSFRYEKNTFSDVYLSGPAIQVFEGIWVS